MIRTTCAWVLVLLAASPVTAPFSSCDLRLLMAHGARLEAPAFEGMRSLSGAEHGGGDAYSLSPLVDRRALPRDSTASLPIRPEHAARAAAGFRALAAFDLSRLPHESSLPPTVLRL